jgi:hypothetical protein
MSVYFQPNMTLLQAVYSRDPQNVQQALASGRVADDWVLKKAFKRAEFLPPVCRALVASHPGIPNDRSLRRAIKYQPDEVIIDLLLKGSRLRARQGMPLFSNPVSENVRQVYERMTNPIPKA